MIEIPKTIIITGASSGIGRALAVHYARDGVFLALTGRNFARLSEVAEICKAKGAMVHAVSLDVTDKEKMADFMETTFKKRAVDLVIANAGISKGVLAGQTKDSDLLEERIFEVNYQGVMNTIKPIIPYMTRRKQGQIALMSSLASYRGFAGSAAYCASKAAVRIYGQALRVELEQHNVKVNIICPGFVHSRITAANDFKMPMILESPKAARIISKGLQRNIPIIGFPFLMHLGAWFIGALPTGLVEVFMEHVPQKGQTKKSEESSVE